MNATLEQVKKQLKLFLSGLSRKQKMVYGAVGGLFMFLIIMLTVFTSTTKYVPLYSNLSIQEAGQIKTELDSRSIPYEIKNGGKIINVPKEQSEQLLLDLAAQGIPRSGNIDYSFFSENITWGMTDNEFNIMKLDAMQTELANLMKGIEGIEDARVMINLPPATVFLDDITQEASASIVLTTSFGYEMKENQISALYHLISKAIPNLPEENIVIMNQMFEFFDRTPDDVKGGGMEYDQQQNIKHRIERDIQKRLQQMLGAVVGMDRVIVSVTADIDFTKENRVEELVEPVDIDNVEGIPLSIETIRETYEGNQASGGVTGTGEGDIPNYPADAENGDGNYQIAKDTINYELNHIHKEISETPYKLRDLGIQVIVDNVQNNDDNAIQILSQQDQNVVREGIESILNSMITTSIAKDYGEINPAEKVSIIFQPFRSREVVKDPASLKIPMWVYMVAAIFFISILFLYLRKNMKRRGNYEDAINMETTGQVNEIPDIQDVSRLADTQVDIQKNHLEKMAKERPGDFAKLLRGWIQED